MGSAKNAKLVLISSKPQLRLNCATHALHQVRQSALGETSTILSLDFGEALSIQMNSISAGLIKLACKYFPNCDLLFLIEVKTLLKITCKEHATLVIKASFVMTVKLVTLVTPLALSAPNVHTL